VEPQFPEPVKTTGSQITEVEHGRARPPDRKTSDGKLTEVTEVEIGILPEDIGKPCAEKASIQRIDARYVESVPIQESPLPLLSTEKFIQDGMISHSDLHFPFDLQADGNGKTGITAEIVRRSIEWVDDPFTRSPPPFERGLFREEIMVGEDITNHLDDGLLAQPIHLRHRVGLSF
jgi:hypothetical protein